MLFTALLMMSLVLMSTTKVCATEYEEITYDDLVNRLNKKKTSIQSNINHPLDSIMIHAGFGLVSSVSSIRIGNSESSRQQNGFQLSFGIDLFSEQWAAEGTILNYGTDSSGSETRTLRELDMKILYRSKWADGLSSRFGAGLSTRTLKISDTQTALNINDTTPAWVFSAGLESFLSRNFSIGTDLGFKFAMISRTADKNAVNFALRLNSYF